MKLLVYGLLVVTATVLATLLALYDPGYLLVSYGHWTLEATVVVASLILLGLFAASHWLLLSIYKVRSLPRRTRVWRSKRQQSKASQFLSTGLVELAEGRWQDAEKNLLRYTDESESPLLNYLAAARAAHGQGAYDRRDNYLKLAIQAMPTADIAVGLTQAEMQLQHGQLEQALASMEHLKRIAPKHKYVIKLLVGVYEQLHDWENMLAHLAQLRKSGIFTDGQYTQLEKRAYLGLLTASSQHDGISQLQALWERLPKYLKNDVAVIHLHVQQLLRLGEGFRAEPLIRQALEHQWEESLAELYGVIPGDTRTQLRYAEKWQHTHGQDANLLLTLARLYLRLELWGKARHQLEASINLGGAAAAHILLSRLLERLGEREAAVLHLTTGLQEYLRERTDRVADNALLEELTAADNNQQLLTHSP